MRRRKYEKMSLSALRKLRDELQVLINEIENGPRREIDIATDHKGDPAFIAEIVKIIGDKKSGKWIQVERIFCSKEKCPECPHGDFHYEYRLNSRKGTTSVRYRGKGFTKEVLEKIGYFEFNETNKTINILPKNE